MERMKKKNKLSHLETREYSLIEEKSRLRVKTSIVTWCELFNFKITRNSKLG